MEFKFRRLEKLLVSLTNGDVFEGVYENGSQGRIDLSNITEYPSGTKIYGVLSFYRNEIESVKRLESTTADEDDNSHKQCNNSEDYKDTILLPQTEYERLKDISRKFIYMATMDNRFFEATEYLYNCETVGVFGIGSELGRQKCISILVMSSWDQVYLFDIQMYRLPDLPPKIKNILESESIKKVVHDSRTLADCLYHCHNKVKLTNVFDTQVADLIVSKKEGVVLKEARNLSQCLQHYFHFPKYILEKPLQISSDKWTVRPIKDSRKIHAALLGTYLITLKNLLERKLLQDYYTVVDKYVNFLKDMSLCDSIENVKCTVPQSIEALL